MLRFLIKIFVKSDSHVFFSIIVDKSIINHIKSINELITDHIFFENHKFGTFLSKNWDILRFFQ